MINYSTKKILTTAINSNGRLAQITKAIEELAELQQALAKYMNEAKNHDNIAEEMADVEIMLEQLTLIFNNSNLVDDWRDSKIERLEENLLKAGAFSE